MKTDVWFRFDINNNTYIKYSDFKLHSKFDFSLSTE